MQGEWEEPPFVDVELVAQRMEPGVQVPRWLSGKWVQSLAVEGLLLCLRHIGLGL